MSASLDINPSALPRATGSFITDVQAIASQLDRPSTAAGGRSFKDVFRPTPNPSGATKTNHEKARDAAEQFVAITFVQPLLKQLRQTSFAAPPFAPGQAEKQFQSLADQALADRIVQASRWPLVDRLTSDLLKRGQGTVPSDAHQSPAATTARLASLSA